MVAWLPAAKIILPHVANIVSVAIPVFTKRKGSGDAAAPLELQQQITELQTAAAHNTAYIKELAEQLEMTLRSLEEGAAAAQQKLRRTWLLSLTSFGIALLAIIFSLFAFLSR